MVAGTPFNQDEHWDKIKEETLTTAIAFDQAALASLDRRTSTGVTGCVTRAPPLLSSCTAGDGALCPLRPGGPAIVTVYSWQQ